MKKCVKILKQTQPTLEIKTVTSVSNKRKPYNTHSSSNITYNRAYVDHFTLKSLNVFHCFCVCEIGLETERETERERDREKHREGEREIERECERKRNRDG